jgi:valyl-tRNA synthetase
MSNKRTNTTQEMPKAFDATIEKQIYELWEESGLFDPEKFEKYLTDHRFTPNKPFVMTLPPPNANGDLHMGHTCGYSFHDAMGRFARMTGHPTLLIAGKDHAGIQTETVFTKLLKEKGIDKWELGRDEFYKQCYEFCINAANNARAQEKRIGLSADWDKEFFTLDPRLTKTIYETFRTMFEEKRIYRDKRIINYCPTDRTALADIDTKHEERRGIFAYITYPFADEADKKEFGMEGITVATTRPETMLADTAVAVNPKDKRYKKMIGKKVILPIMNREIPIIADEYIDIETGTGALKVTPAHAQADFDIALRNDLPMPSVISGEGKMTGDIPERFLGMDTIECSKAICAELKELGLLQKIENIKHDVATCERCGTPIQPILSYQWFLKTDDLAKKALRSIKSGETEIIPEGQRRALIHFYENIEPWCISRQLWWGHRIPIWYSGSKELHDWLLDNPEKTTDDYEKETGKQANGTGDAIFSEEKPAGKGHFEEETDVLDTWFSSGQWPFSTLMAIDKFNKEYFPTDNMVHDKGIVFFWSGRMMMMSHYRTEKAPFKKIFVHGTIMASDGQKMSKSKGNGVSPIYLFDKYGADALRMWYYTDVLPGSNAPFREEKMKGNRNFINKIWNASRFVMMNINDGEAGLVAKKQEKIAEEWKQMEPFGGLGTSLNKIAPDILERAKSFYRPLTIPKLSAEGKVMTYLYEHKQNILSTKGYLEKYQFHLAAETIRRSFWLQFCDEMIEGYKNEIREMESKSEKRIEKLSELIFILKEYLKSMHPLMPYITEAVWQQLADIGLAEGLLMAQQL